MKKHSLRLIVSISTLVLTLAVCLQLLLPASAYASTTSFSGKFCISGSHMAQANYSWTDNGKTNYYYGYVDYTVNVGCTQVTVDQAYNQLTKSRAFVSWWDHNQYASSWWGTGCPIDSTDGNRMYINSGGVQAGYYFQIWLSDNGCHWLQENMFYFDLGPLTD